MATYVRFPRPGIPTYASAANFPTSAVDGSQAIARDTDTIYIYDSVTLSWIAVASPGAAPTAITALIGDVTATGPGAVPATVVSVGGQSASNVAAATVLANAATAADTPGAIVKRDGSGNFATNSIQLDSLSASSLVGSNGTKSLVSGALTGDVTTSAFAATLANTAVTPGSYGSATQVGQFTADSKGRLTAATNVSIQIAESQVNNLVSDLAGKQPTGNYLTALTGDVTASGPGSAAATLVNTTVVAGSYGSGSSIPSFTVDAKGRLTAAAGNAISASGITHSGLSGLTTGDAGHTQFAQLAGRAGGQTLRGGTAVSEDLTLISNSSGTPGSIFLGVASETTGIWVSPLNQLIIGEDFLGIADLCIGRETDIAGNVKAGLAIVPVVEDSLGGGTFYGVAVQPSFTGTTNPGNASGVLFSVTCDATGTGGTLIGAEIGCNYDGASGSIDEIIGCVVTVGASGAITSNITGLAVGEPSGGTLAQRAAFNLDGSYVPVEHADASASGVQNAYVVASANIYFDGNAITLNGLAGGGRNKRVLIQVNSGMTINHLSASAAAGDKINTNTGLPVVITGRGSAEFIWSTVDQNWNLLWASL